LNSFGKGIQGFGCWDHVGSLATVGRDGESLTKKQHGIAVVGLNGDLIRVWRRSGVEF
jgi:hypothetical protein